MRHLRKVKQLRRVASQRKALLKSLAVSLIDNGKIKTTVPKAKALQPYIEKIITKAKQKDLGNIRILSGTFPKKTVKLLFDGWGPAFLSRNGGYTRITKIGQRISDASPMAFIEFIDKMIVVDVKKKEVKKAVKKGLKEEKKEKGLTKKTVEKKDSVKA